MVIIRINEFFMNRIFVINHIFYIFVEPRRVPIVKNHFILFSIVSFGMKLPIMFTIVLLNNATGWLIPIRESLFSQSKSLIRSGLAFLCFETKIHMEVDNRFLDWNWKKLFGDGSLDEMINELRKELITKFSWEVNVRSIQQTEDSGMCYGSWMICVRPYWAIKSFKIDPSYKLLFKSNQGLFLALKSPNAVVKKCFLNIIMCNVDSKLVIKLEKLLCDWLGDRYRATWTYTLIFVI